MRVRPGNASGCGFCIVFTSEPSAEDQLEAETQQEARTRPGSGSVPAGTGWRTPASLLSPGLKVLQLERIKAAADQLPALISQLDSSLINPKEYKRAFKKRRPGSCPLLRTRMLMFLAALSN